MLQVSLLALALATVPASPPADPNAITLEEAVHLALGHHPDIGKAQAGAEALKGRIREVRSQALPEITLRSGATRWRDPSLLNASGLDKFPEELRTALVPEGVNLFDYSVRISQPLYTAGKVGTALKLAAVEAEGATAEIDRAEQDLALAVVKAFYALLWAERYRGLVAEIQQQRRLHAEMARTRYRNGVATEVDALRAEVAVANGNPDLVRADNAIRHARALLNYYLVRPIDWPTKIAGEFDEQPWEEWDQEALTREALRRRPELNRLRISERSTGVQLDLARAQNRMRIDFQGAYGIMSRLPSNLFNARYTSWNLGVNFTFPVFDGFKRSGLVWQASAAQRAARLEREKGEQQVRLTLQQGLDEIAAARETIAAARANISQAERVLAMTQNNYKFGAATTLDILDAQTALSAARTNLLRGLHEAALARADLRWAMGVKPWE